MVSRDHPRRHWQLEAMLGESGEASTENLAVAAAGAEHVAKQAARNAAKKKDEGGCGLQ